jgi:hypothetical protein
LRVSGGLSLTSPNVCSVINVPRLAPKNPSKPAIPMSSQPLINPACL